MAHASWLTRSDFDRRAADFRTAADGTVELDGRRQHESDLLKIVPVRPANP